MDLNITGKLGISGSRDTSVKLWNLEISDLVATWRGHEAQVTCVDIAENEVFAVTGSEDTTVKVWSIIMGCVITDYKVRCLGVYVFLINNRLLSDFFSFTKKNQIIFSFDFRQRYFVHTITYS